MPCIIRKDEEGVSAIICSSGRKAAPSCDKCFKASKYQCDFPVGAGKTCDRHLCFDHVRHGATKGIDFCEEHFPIAKEAWERRRQEKGMKMLFDLNFE